MLDATQTGLLPAREVVRTTAVTTAANGLRYASYGYNELSDESLRQIVEAAPPGLAAALSGHAYYFVPLALGETEETEIAAGFTMDLGDRATCHRNVLADGVDCTFISARLMQDRFALAFEFFINLAHQMVDTSGVPQRFRDLAWSQARAGVRGETSQDAFEARNRAMEGLATIFAVRTDVSSSSREKQEDKRSARASSFGALLVSREDTSGPSGGLDDGQSQARSLREDFAHPGNAPDRALQEQAPQDQRAGNAFFEAAFADTLAIYMLSLSMDLDYADLREREYPLLAAPALADRLRLAAELFPPGAGYEFSIRYRRRH